MATRILIMGAAGRDFHNFNLVFRDNPACQVVAFTATQIPNIEGRTYPATLKAMGKRLVVVRHPMPYGDLTRQAVQRFATMDDLTKENVTIEEREEYEPHIARGSIVFAGADYEKILRRAEEEADIILWDGGNNDMPFFQPDLLFVVADP